MVLMHLSSGFTPYGASLPFQQFTFKGGEPHIKLTDPLWVAGKSVLITVRMNNYVAMGYLKVAVDALRRAGAGPISLLIPYFPGARQDRVMVPGEPLSVRLYADDINRLGFQQVIVLDPHSDVTPALLDRCRVVNNHAYIRRVVDEIQPDALVSPDAGAMKKIYPLAAELGGIPVIECGKKRDPATGALSGFTVPATGLTGLKLLIVDDICDGGGTFLGLADALKDAGAGLLYLAVSHGIFSQGVNELLKLYEGVFTTDSFTTLPATARLTTVLVDSFIAQPQ